MSLKKKLTFASKLLLVFVFFIFLISACNGQNSNITGISTWTPSPSATPTCDPDISLATPSGWNTVSRLIILLFDPHSTQDSTLELSDGKTTQNVIEFINTAFPKIIRPGDQVSIFQLGYRKYENARYLRAYSYIELPQLYDTPSPQETMTPLVIPVKGTLENFQIPKATLEAGKTQVAYNATATAIDSSYKCKVKIWNDSAIFTATSYSQTEVAESSIILSNFIGAATTATKTVEDKTVPETPYSNDVVYEGLYHASLDLESDCSNYDECILIVIDDLNTWTYGNRGDFEINLEGVSLAYVIMPNCKDLNQPSCQKLKNFWDREFHSYGAPPITFANGTRAEINLLDILGRR
jgi:hypothetical protein